MRSSLFRAAAVLSLLATGTAQAAQTPQCMTRAEMHGMVGYFLPSVLDTTIKTCANQVSSGAFLKMRAPALVSELNQKRDQSWPMARKAFGKFAGSAQEMEKLPDDLMKPIIDETIASQLGSKITPSNCQDIERVMAPMAPLPGTNVVDLVTEIFMVALRKDKKLPTCS